MNTMKDDMISRQAAVEVMRKATDKSEAHRMLVQLPSATDTNVSGNLSVDELIKFLNPESNYVFYDDAHGFCINTQDVIDYLCDMPSAQPGWIPVTERFPDKEGPYLCTVQGYVGKATYLRIADFHPDIYIEYDIEEHKPGFIDYDSEYGFYEVTKVLAWMPLPKTWEGEKDER